MTQLLSFLYYTNNFQILLLLFIVVLSYPEIICDPAYPGQWRVKGAYIEQVAKMTHWEYPEAIKRFGRQFKLSILQKS